MAHELKIIQIRESGYKTLYTFGTWKIASSVAIERERIRCMDRHLETDEAFVMLEGSGFLFTWGGEDRPMQTRGTVLELNHVYLVPRGTWHAHVWKQQTKVLIVENADTGAWNSETIPIPKAQRKEMEEYWKNIDSVVKPEML